MCFNWRRDGAFTLYLEVWNTSQTTFNISLVCSTCEIHLCNKLASKTSRKLAGSYGKGSKICEISRQRGNLCWQLTGDKRGCGDNENALVIQFFKGTPQSGKFLSGKGFHLACLKKIVLGANEANISVIQKNY